VVVTTGESAWIDDDRAWEVFGDREAVQPHHGRVEAWALAAQVLRPDQLDLLDYLLWDWRRHNPDMVKVSFVRFSNFAIGRGKSANAEVLAASGLLRQRRTKQGRPSRRPASETDVHELGPLSDPALAGGGCEGRYYTTPEGLSLTDVSLDRPGRELPKNAGAGHSRQPSIRKPELSEVLAQVRARHPTRTHRHLVERTNKSLHEMLKTADPHLPGSTRGTGGPVCLGIARSTSASIWSQ
jgi:hypothetical protein